MLMDLSDKIKLILSGKNISPSIFADEIGIQRSSMSHILAGRNKPSLDIVQKIVKRFPELGVGWVWDDEELPLISADITTSESESDRSKFKEKEQISATAQLAGRKEATRDMVQENLTSQVIPVQKPRTVDKIVVFYSDGTYQELST